MPPRRRSPCCLSLHLSTCILVAIIASAGWTLRRGNAIGFPAVRRAAFRNALTHCRKHLARAAFGLGNSLCDSPAYLSRPPGCIPENTASAQIDRQVLRSSVCIILTHLAVRLRYDLRQRPRALMYSLVVQVVPIVHSTQLYAMRK